MAREKSNPTPCQGIHKLDQYNPKKHPQKQKWYYNLIQGRLHPVANKRQFSTTHSSSLMFPADVENVTLGKWDSG